MSLRQMRSNLPSAMRGLSLVELMISLVLGLLVVGGAITVFMSNRQAYSMTENLGRMQESGRSAFEMMARDLREAGGNACERDIPVHNVLNNAGTDWWATWGAAVTGFESTVAFPGAAFGTAAGERVSGTDGLEIKSAVSAGVTVDDHTAPSANFKVNKVNHGLDDGDVIMVCDFDHATITQVTNASPGTNNTIVHNEGTGTPGNSTKCLAHPDVNGACGNGAVQTYSFGCFQGRRLASGDCAPLPDGTAAPNWPAHIAKLQAWRWYIGNNASGGRSLYRTGLRNLSGTLSPAGVEVAQNVTDMQLTYLENGAATYVDSTAVIAWNEVTAVRITLTIDSPDAVATGGGRLQRQIRHIVALRNRTP